MQIHRATRIDPALFGRITLEGSGVICHSPRTGGFTLFELVVVIAIIAVSATLAVPRYGSALTRYRVESAAQRVASDLDLARSMAHSQSRTISVAFDLAADRYQFSTVMDPDDPASPYRVLLGQPPYRAEIDSVWFAGSTIAGFNGYGAPESGGTVVVNAGVRFRTVVVDEDTGATRINVTEQATADLLRAGDGPTIESLGVTP